MSFVKTFLDNTLFITPSFQMIFKLTQSFFQRFVGGGNSPDSKSLTVWYALSHMRRMTLNPLPSNTTLVTMDVTVNLVELCEFAPPTNL